MWDLYVSKKEQGGILGKLAVKECVNKLKDE